MPRSSAWGHIFSSASIYFRTVISIFTPLRYHVDSDVPQKLEHPWPPLSQRGQPWSPLTTTNLDTTNLELLVETINQLPPSTTKPISIDRQIHVSGMRSNRWFQVHYNINNPPDEVGRLYDIMHVPFRSKPKTQAGSMAPVK